MVEIPLSVDTPSYTFRTTLRGVEYVLRIDYAQREDRYYLDVFTVDLSPIYRGRKIVCGVPLLRGCADYRQPQGFLLAYDVKSPTADPPGFAELGRRVRLFFDPFLPSALPLGPLPASAGGGIPVS